MSNIQELTEKENKLLAQVNGIVGSMNEKTRQLSEMGVFSSYRELHNEYAALAKAGNVEALKRAFFIQWYAVSEPSCFTGIPGTDPWGDGTRLDKNTEEVVFDLVAQHLSSDDELRWMAAWYYQISDYYFEAFWGNSVTLENLRSYIREIGSLEKETKFTDEPLEKRGQMGEYFVSIFQSNESSAK